MALVTLYLVIGTGRGDRETYNLLILEMFSHARSKLSVLKLEWIEGVDSAEKWERQTGRSSLV